MFSLCVIAFNRLVRRGSGFESRWVLIIFSFDCYKLLAVVPSLKQAKTTLRELSLNNNLVDIEIVLEVLKPAESKSGLYFGLYMFLRRFRSFLGGPNGSFCWFLKHVKFLVKTRQSGLPELHRYRKRLKILSI